MLQAARAAEGKGSHTRAGALSSAGTRTLGAAWDGAGHIVRAQKEPVRWIDFMNSVHEETGA